MHSWLLWTCVGILSTLQKGNRSVIQPQLEALQPPQHPHPHADYLASCHLDSYFSIQKSPQIAWSPSIQYTRVLLHCDTLVPNLWTTNKAFTGHPFQASLHNCTMILWISVWMKPPPSPALTKSAAVFLSCMESHINILQTMLPLRQLKSRMLSQWAIRKILVLVYMKNGGVSDPIA